MADKNYYMQQSIGDEGIAPVYNPARIQTSPRGAFINAPAGLNVGQYFNNNTIDSDYAETIGDVNAAIRAGRTVEDLLAEKQSGWEMAGNALLNNAVIAGTTMISGTLGIADGILEALVNGEASKLWDNTVNNWAADTQEAVKEAFPIYRGEEYNNASIWDKMGTGIFWADLVENLGFTEGMLVPGMAASKVFQGLGKGATMLGSAFTSSLGEGSVEAINERNDEVKNKTAIANQRYNELAQTVDSSELPGLYNQYLETINDIEDDANNAGNFTFGANIALLTLTNAIEFSNLFSRGFSTGRRMTGQLAREGERYIADSGTKAIAKATGKKLVDAFSEGMEEVSQKAISGTAQYYTDYNKFNESVFNPEKRELVGNLISAFGESYANTMQDPQTAEEFASGFLIGLTGVPQLRRAKIPVTVENNIIGDIYSAYKNNKREQELANTINDRLANSKEFKAYYDGIVRHLVMQDDINTAIDEADHTAYENAISAQMISDIMMFDDAGHLDNLRELVNNSVDLSDAGVDAIIEETAKDGEGPFMSNGNKMDIEEARELIKRKQEYINHKIDFISKSKNELEAAFPNLDETGVANALFLKSQIEDQQTRFNSLKDEARAGIAKLFDSYIAPKEDKKKARKGTVYVTAEDGKKHYVRPEDIEYIDSDGTAVLKEKQTDKVEVNPYKKFIPTGEELIANLNNPVFGEIVQELLNSDNSSMAYDERLKLSETLKDLGKLQAGLIELNKSLSTALTNPEQTNNSKQEALNKTIKANEAKEEVKKKDKIANSEVSEIVQDIESGDIAEGELSSLFTDEDNEFLNNINEEQPLSGKQKVEEAKKIVDTSRRVERALNSLSSTADPQAIADAKILLRHSKEVSESEQEMLDTATQAFNDPDILFNETDESLQNLTIDELDWVLGERIDAAKTVIEEAKAIVQAEQGELADLKNLSTEGTVVRTLGAEALKETGHDATTKVEPENERVAREEEVNKKEAEKKANKERLSSIFDELRSQLPTENVGAFNNALNNVLSQINTLTSAGVSGKELGNTIKGTESYTTLESLVPNIAEYLNKYVVERKQVNTTTPEQVEEQKVPTPVISEQEIRTQTTEQQNKDVNESEPQTYQYWKPTISYLPFGKAFKKGNNTPFYKIARTLTNANGTQMFTEQQINRIEAVGEYLDEHGAFKLVDSGEVKAGDEIHFVIDSALNEQAGEVVILMADKQGRIVGDVMSPNDRGFTQQLGLKAFVDRITEAYRNAGSPQYFEDFPEVTKVDKNKVGKVPYLADSEGLNTLNEIFNDGVKSIPFNIGIAASSGANARVLASPGRTKQQGQSDFERSILPPLTAIAGQPFLLLPTSSSINHYIPIPIQIGVYDGNTGRTALGRAIHSVLEKVPTSDNSNAIDIVRGLEELLSLQEVHINYYEDNVKVTIKPYGAEHQRSIYNGSKNAEDIVSQLELGLQVQRLPFQVSRKYINDTYQGQDYNTMIGEVAKVNLPIGTLHTVSDWFTINPLDISGKMVAAKSPKSIGVNPYAATISPIPVNVGGGEILVNPRTWEATKEGNVITGLEADKAKAQAFGLHTNQNMSEPYNTKWGYYDPKTNSFVQKQTEVVRTLGTETVEQAQSTPTQETPAQLEEKARDAGLLSNKVREALWKELTPEQQSIIANKKGPKQEHWMTALEGAFNVTTNTFDEKRLQGNVNDLLSRKGLYRQSNGEQPIWNKERELKWLQKVLPNLSNEEHLRIVEGLIKISKSANPDFAWGMFKNGVITISDQAASGTAYHEAFHAVVHTLLSDDEYNTLFNEARKKWKNLGDVAVEENLAEGFRRYMQLEETPIIGEIVKLYRKLKHFLQNLLGKEPYISKLYYNISRGNYASREVDIKDSLNYRMAEGFNGTVAEFQSIVDNLINRGMKTRVSKNKEWGRLVDIWKSEGYEVKGYWNNETKKWTVTSAKSQEQQYREIEQHYRDKLMYENLNQEDKDYLNERGISIEEYANMTPTEKEVLLHCKY